MNEVKYSWQISLRSYAEGEDRGTLVELFNPLTDQHVLIKVAGRETSHKPPNTSASLAERLANKLDKKRNDLGLEVPNFRQRLITLLKQQYGY